MESPAVPIRNILFDLGNVLVDLNMPRVREQTAALFGLPFEELVESLGDLFHRFEVGRVSEVLFVNHLIRHSGKRLDANKIIHAWNSMIGDFPIERLQMLLELRRRYKVYLFSNTNVTHLRHVHRILWRDHQLRDFEARFFDKAYYSHQIHLRKPEPEAFLFIAADAGLHPSETLFIDDMPANIEAAASVGYQVMLHDPQKDITKILLQQL